MGNFFDYSKPDMSEDENVQQENRVMAFVNIYIRKFWNLIKLNLLFFLFDLPAMLLAFLVPDVLFRNVKMDANMEAYWTLIGSFILCVPALTVGPAQAGFTYILRNYAREKHAFIWSDFKEHALKNLKQSIIISVIDFIVIIFIGNAANYYMTNGTKGIMYVIAAAIIVLFFTIFMMMHIYIYPMLVTFKLTVKEIYKNAAIFSLMKFLPNLCILILSMLVMLAIFCIKNAIGYVLFPVITMSTIGLLTNFYSYPILKKYLIDQANVENTDITEENN